MKNESLKYHISDPVIAPDHRDAYEQIMMQINGISSICGVGRCKAVEASGSSQKQAQVNDLMDQAEFFSVNLVKIIKRFFDQLYRSRELSSQSIARASSKIKIEMVERNLLERTCDVRWWALEKAFWDCIQDASLNPSRFKNIISEHEHLLSQVDFPLPKLPEFIVDQSMSLGLGQDHLNHLKAYLNQVSNALETTDIDDPDSRTDIIEQFEKHLDKVNHACLRLEDIRSSYTLYRDLVIVDLNGTVVASANQERRNEVLGLNVSNEKWYKEALTTTNGQDYRVQDLSPSILEEEDSLIYSTALRLNGDEKGEIIGVMGVLFDFQGETELILRDYLPMNGGHPISGWRSFFTNKQGKVICSSDEWGVPSYQQADLPQEHCLLTSQGEEKVSTVIMKGHKTLVSSIKTNGFDDYEGVGWVSHFTMPESAMFVRNESTGNYGISADELIVSKIVPDNNKEINQELQSNKEDVELISINGIVLAMDLGHAGLSFIPIFDQVTKTGNLITQKMDQLLQEMSSDMLKQNFVALKNYAKQAIDLIDRNLFERAADVRWWSSDHVFWEALEQPSDENFSKADDRLAIINASYTMYRDLVLADKGGNIKASSNPDRKNDVIGTNVIHRTWFKQSAKSGDSNLFAVQDVCKDDLEPEPISLIYSSSVIKGGARKGAPVGVLGILFDWNESKPILNECLPTDQHGIIEGSAAFYVNKDHHIIATTNDQSFPIGKKIDPPKSCLELHSGQSSCGIITIDGNRFLIGSSKTKGYREYKGMEWIAHVIRPFD